MLLVSDSSDKGARDVSFALVALAGSWLHSRSHTYTFLFRLQALIPPLGSWTQLWSVGLCFPSTLHISPDSGKSARSLLPVQLDVLPVPHGSLI